MKKSVAWLLAVAMTVACGDEKKVDPADPLPPDRIDDPGEPDVPRNDRLAIEEAGITLGTDGDLAGLVATVPIRGIGDGVGIEATLDVWITRLDTEEELGTKGSTQATLTADTTEVSVLIPGAEAPENAEQAGWLVRYEARVVGSASAVGGAKSLFHTLPKPGLRMWAPARLDAGSTTVVRLWALELLGGGLLADQEVSLNGQKATTDVAGQAAFEVSAPTDGSDFALEAHIVSKGSSASLSFTPQVVAEGAPLVYVSTDKPLYRPGQTIHVRALSLKQKDLTPVSGEPVTLELLDGKGNKMFKEDTLTDDYGVASLTPVLAAQVNVGSYTVRAIAAGVTAERLVEVSEEKLPKFAVTVSFDQPYFSPGEAITGSIQAKYFFGKAVADADVALEASGQVQVGKTNAEGFFAFELPASNGGQVPVQVTVTDSAGFAVEKAGAISVFQKALSVTAIPEAQQVAGTGPWQVWVLVRDPLSQAVDAECRAKDGADPVQTGADGVVLLEVGETQPTITCSTADGLEGSRALNLYQAPPGEGLLLRTDRGLYARGEPIAVTVIAPGVDSVWVDRVHRGRIVESHEVAITDGEGALELIPADSDGGTNVLSAWFFDSEQRRYAAERIAYVQKPFAEVSVTTDEPTYLPGGEAQLTFAVKDSGGQGRAAAIGVTIADEAVFALAGGQGPDDVTGYFTLDDAPASVRPFALAPDTGPVQEAASAALVQSNAGQTGSLQAHDLGGLIVQARAHYRPALQAVVEGVQKQLEAEVASGALNYQNGEESVEDLQLHDFWGQRFRVDANLQRWSGRLRVTIWSNGPDELPETEDDWGDSFSLRDLQHRPPADTGWDEQADSPGAYGGAEDTADDDGYADTGTEDTDTSDGPEAEPDGASPKKRTDFPETLYVNPALITDGQGKAVITLPMADAITEWRVSMIANTATGEVGGGQGGITVFQDFFVDADLPRKLTQNDALSLPVGVFNFSDEDQEVTVSLDVATWFQLDGPAAQTVTVPAGKSVATPFAVTVLEAGHHELSVTASSATLIDAIGKTVQVLPDGQRLDGSKSGPLEASEDATVSFPASAIEGGNDLFVKIMGGPSSQLIDGVDALLSVPRGCFEPMMNSTWINALVLDYLVWTGSTNEGMKATAKANLDDGFQQCATFECKGGGFTWFGEPDPAHPILTAFALVMFDDIASVRDVDAGLVGRAQALLAGLQGDMGEWQSEQGTKNQLLPWDELRSTCIVAWGLAQSGYEDADVLAKANSYLLEALDLESADTYTIAMCANALLALDPEGNDVTDTVVAELLDRALTEEGKTHWTSEYAGFTHAGGEVLDVETTALVSQALYRLDPPPVLVEGALKYLAGMKSPDGNFRSTQGTIQSLRAFVAAAKYAASEVDADVSIQVGGQDVFTTHIDGGNKEVVHLVSLTEHVLAAAGADLPVTLSVTGEGKLFYQVVTRHYVPWTPETRPVGPLMDVAMTYSKTTFDANEHTEGTVTVTSTGPAEPGDMPMVDFGVPPGFDADLTNLDAQVAADPNVARYEVKGDRVVIYLHHLPEEPGTAFELMVPLKPRFPMTVTTPAARAWSYYKPDQVSESLPVVLTVN